MKYRYRILIAIVLMLVMLGPRRGLLPLPAPSPVQAQGGWTIECVDCPKQFSNMTDRSLALDLAGHPHIAYGREDLYYAYHDGSVWHYETVTPP
jgi:hypothetical protein